MWFIIRVGVMLSIRVVLWLAGIETKYINQILIKGE
jgi:hypothetical protein